MLERFLKHVEESSRRSTKNIRVHALEALDSLRDEGAPLVSAYQVRKRIEELHPPKHWWKITGYGTLYLALDQLIEDGVIVRKEIPVENPQEGQPKRRYLYYGRPEPQQLPK